MKKRLLAMLLTGALCASMAACSSGGEASTGETGGETGGESSGSGYSVDVILKTTASEYWQYVQAGAMAYMQDNPDVTVTVKGAPSETSYQDQLNMIQTDLADDSYDGYVIAPLQADMVANLISGQTKPIVAVDTKIDAPEVLSFVGTGNESAGALGGAAAVEAANAAGWTDIKAIEIAGVQGDTTNTDRMNGYMKGIEEAGGDFLEDEVQYADAVATKAVDAMNGIMSRYPDGIAIICANNDDMAIAAAKAAADSGNEAYANTIFLGFDGIQSACDAILEGRLTMSVAQQGYEMGYMAVEAVVNNLNGEEVEEFIDSGADVVTADNAQERKETLQGYLDALEA